jgi:hypothetical protein
MTSSDEPTGSVAPGVSRRRFLQATGLGAADSSAALPAGWSGTIRDVTHVVILMQENRSFDHYFGTFRGVRGFGDKQILTYANGTSVFAQPDKGRTDLGYLLPYNLTDQVHGDLDHSWVGDHAARNGGLWNNWVAAKTEETMGYFTRNEIPFQYALADAFTICDGYHQSIMGPTSPNGCTCGRARRAASSPTRTTTRWTSGLTPARARSRPTPGVVDRRPGGLQRAPVLHPRLRGALREHRASDAVLEPRSVEEHGHAQTVTVTAGRSKIINWPADPYGYYGVVITAASAGGFRRRYASRIA